MRVVAMTWRALFRRPCGEGGTGMMYCADPANTTLLRYVMITEISAEVGPWCRNRSKRPSNTFAKPRFFS
jgi:hypothetical protein